jgi:hypothetical protein
MAVTRGESGRAVMRGIDGTAHGTEHRLAPAAMENLIREGRLIPSVFTCFLTLALARGVNCLGGYYQAEYLPAMQAGLLQALSESDETREMMDAVERIPTDRYLSGMQTVMTSPAGGLLVPAGPLEIMAEKGLSEFETERILAMSVEDAHMASLSETIPDIAPGEHASADWKHALAQDLFATLRHRVVVK